MSLIIKEVLSACLQTQRISKQFEVQLERLKISNPIIMVMMTQSRNFVDFMKPN
jgi:hypothetical protein